MYSTKGESFLFSTVTSFFMTFFLFNDYCCNATTSNQHELCLFLHHSFSKVSISFPFPLHFHRNFQWKQMAVGGIIRFFPTALRFKKVYRYLFFANRNRPNFHACRVMQSLLIGRRRAHPCGFIASSIISLCLKSQTKSHVSIHHRIDRFTYPPQRFPLARHTSRFKSKNAFLVPWVVVT